MIWKGIIKNCQQNVSKKSRELKKHWNKQDEYTNYPL